MSAPRILLGQGFVATGAMQPLLNMNGMMVEKDGQKAKSGKKNWMKDVKIKRPGICTGEKLGSKSCPPGSRQYALAQTFKHAAKKGGKKGGSKKSK